MGVDDQVIDVGQLADDADRAAGDGVGERRQPRLEEADVRIERRVGEPQRHLRVHLVGQGDPARAGDDQAGEAASSSASAARRAATNAR